MIKGDTLPIKILLQIDSMLERLDDIIVKHIPEELKSLPRYCYGKRYPIDNNDAADDVYKHVKNNKPFHPVWSVELVANSIIWWYVTNSRYYNMYIEQCDKNGFIQNTETVYDICSNAYPRLSYRELDEIVNIITNEIFAFTNKVLPVAEYSDNIITIDYETKFFIVVVEELIPARAYEIAANKIAELESCIASKNKPIDNIVDQTIHYVESESIKLRQQ